MRRFLITVALVFVAAGNASAQPAAGESELRRAAPYSEMAKQFPGLTLRDYEEAIRVVASENAAEAPALPTLRYSAPTPTYTAPKYSNTRRRSNGDTVVNGFNYETGSTWNTTIKPNGSMNGLDGNLNPWSYDSRSGTYSNFGTGVTCFGKGALRTCY